MTTKERVPAVNWPVEKDDKTYLGHLDGFIRKINKRIIIASRDIEMKEIYNDKIYMRRSDTMKWVRFKVPAKANQKYIDGGLFPDTVNYKWSWMIQRKWMWNGSPETRSKEPETWR